MQFHAAVTNCWLFSNDTRHNLVEIDSSAYSTRCHNKKTCRFIFGHNYRFFTFCTIRKKNEYSTKSYKKCNFALAVPPHYLVELKDKTRQQTASCSVCSIESIVRNFYDKSSRVCLKNLFFNILEMFSSLLEEIFTFLQVS